VLFCVPIWTAEDLTPPCGHMTTVVFMNSTGEEG